MTLGRSLADQGIYPYDTIVTDATFATFITVLFGQARHHDTLIIANISMNLYH